MGFNSGFKGLNQYSDRLRTERLEVNSRCECFLRCYVKAGSGSYATFYSTDIGGKATEA